MGEPIHTLVNNKTTEDTSVVCAVGARGFKPPTSYTPFIRIDVYRILLRLQCLLSIKQVCKVFIMSTDSVISTAVAHELHKKLKKGKATHRFIFIICVYLSLVLF